MVAHAIPRGRTTYTWYVSCDVLFVACFRFALPLHAVRSRYSRWRRRESENTATRRNRVHAHSCLRTLLRHLVQKSPRGHDFLAVWDNWGKATGEAEGRKWLVTEFRYRPADDDSFEARVPVPERRQLREMDDCDMWLVPYTVEEATKSQGYMTAPQSPIIKLRRICPWPSLSRPGKHASNSSVPISARCRRIVKPRRVWGRQL
ncbi:hypothetical protein NEUTE1DRAFT_111950 [Neurospora tetrasperma FGSC 2508]|uniref:Uncharacterized protein n=1 Tax=Neurospora tetrasperma (strain FGSC 2508 / ATCC MYA-4615 / P0657) TaxID=510951 RepID=F8MTS1_NEUT8|nr:uncharacterized protein NEUTE1DRAFT_111950 [Neurospora tetrasperma FGSC 2508]EGO55403.1 hypothetical protein NEUTE1DRAFT_111950 [Neurospora tetrasperma FGSC 2508]EGZ69370.1 hypothetical protein NEUTE2DRAFT_71370 [Neurospora tetrasperma FGSC 2509]